MSPARLRWINSGEVVVTRVWPAPTFAVHLAGARGEVTREMKKKIKVRCCGV